MRTLFVMTAVALALGAAACNNDTTEADLNTDADVATNDTAMNDALGMDNAAALMPTDAAGFAAAVASSDMFEIESGKLAEAQGSSADVKSFGAKLQADHQKSTADLKAAAEGIAVAPALDAEKRGMLDQLKAASGAEFDRIFVEQQKTAHEKALSLLKNYQAAGDNEALKGFAGKATPVVQAHLDHLNGMKP